MPGYWEYLWAMESQRWTVAGLRQVASENGYSVTARQLESWRNQGLLPKQIRGPQDGLRPTWSSPPGTDQQLLRLCELRQGTKDPAALLIRLWLQGGPQSLGQVRGALMEVLDDAERTISQAVIKIQQSKHVRGLPYTEEEALRELARRFTLARVADHILPRVRTGRSYRLPGVTVLLQIFVTGQVPEGVSATGDDVGRALGLWPRGRLDRLDRSIDPAGTAPSWLGNEPLDLDYLARTVSLPALRAGLATASDEDLRYAARALEPLTNGLRLFARFSGAFHYDRAKFLGLQALRNMRSTPELPTFLICLVLVIRQSDLRDNLERVVEALEETRRVLGGFLRQLARFGPIGFEARNGNAMPAKMTRRLQSVADEFPPGQDGTS